MGRKRQEGPRERGSIVERSRGTFLVRVFVGIDETTGKRKYHSETVKGTRRDAERARTKILRDIDGGAYIAPAKDTLKEFVPAWLKTKKGSVTSKTLHGYELRLKKDVLPTLGARKLSKITPMDIQGIVDAVKEEGKSAATAHHTYGVLSMVLEQAVIWGLIATNPASRGITLPKKPRQGSAAQVLTPAQARILFEDSIGHRFHALWVLLLTTGLRPSEALALSWSDIEGNKLTVSKSLEVDPTDRYKSKITEVKTEGSRGTIPLFDMTVEALKAHRVQQAKDRLAAKIHQNPLDLIFCTRDGEPFNMAYMLKEWHKALKRAKLPKVRLYDTRHTHATHLLVAGEHPKIVQERLRHSNISMTLDTYSHLVPGMQDEAMGRAERRLYG